MFHRVPLFATAALLIAGALTGTCREPNACPETAASERALETPVPEPKAPEATAPQGATTEPVLTAENAATPTPPAPARETTKPNRKGRPAWPPPPELIA